MPKIKILRDRVVFEGKFLSLIFRDFVGTKGIPSAWEMIKRKTHGDIVAIIPITPQNEIILTKIYRIPLKKYVIELCAGLADQKGESSAALARRELLEETGYVAERLIRVARGVFNAGRDSDHMIIYIAENAKKLREPKNENAEDITVLKVPLRKLARFLTHPPHSTEVDLKLFGVFHLLERHGYKN